MSDLVAFLRAQLAQDERVIRSNSLELWPGDFLRRIADEHERDPEHFAWKPHDVSPQRIAHILCFDPRRMLAGVESKREIVDVCARNLEYTPTSGADLAAAVLRSMTLPYADRPGYDPAWSEK